MRVARTRRVEYLGKNINSLTIIKIESVRATQIKKVFFRTKELIFDLMPTQ